MYKKFCYAVATLFGIGYMPTAPGTWGSLMSLFLIIPPTYFWGFWGLLGAAAFFAVFGTLAAREVLRDTPEDQDPSYIVVDEALGMSVGFCLLPFFSYVSRALEGSPASLPLLFPYSMTGADEGYSFLLLFLGFCLFLLFRVFDIWKPGPIRVVERRIPGAAGVMLDDVLSGVASVFTFCVLLAIYLHAR